MDEYQLNGHRNMLDSSAEQCSSDIEFSNRLDSGLASLDSGLESLRSGTDSYGIDKPNGNVCGNSILSGDNNSLLYDSKTDTYQDDGYCYASRLDSGIDSIQSLCLEEFSKPRLPPSTIGTDALEKQTCKHIFEQDDNGNTALHRSIIEKNYDDAYNIISSCPDPSYLNIKNNWQQTALHLGVLTDQPFIVRSLVVCGAMLDCKSANGNTPLHIACGLGLAVHIDMLTEQLDATEEGAGFRKGHIFQNVNAANYEGFSPIHLAAQSGHDHVIDILVKELHCQVDYPDATSGRTALHHAVDNNNASCIKALINNHADVNALTWDDCSPLHVAVGASKPVRAHINLLIEHGADVFLVTGDDMDVLDLSLQNKRVHQMMRKRQKEQASKNMAMLTRSPTNVAISNGFHVPVTTRA